MPLQYKIAKGNPDKVEEQVNTLLLDGWSLHGSPDVYLSNNIAFVIQALVRSVDEKNPSPPEE